MHRTRSGCREIRWVSGGAAVLCGTKAGVEHDERLPADEGIAVQPLNAYRGHTSVGVMVGTIHKAKGLDFTNVFLPRYDEVVRSAEDRECRLVGGRAEHGLRRHARARETL